MRKCDQDSCTDLAIALVHWPGRDRSMCLMHQLKAFEVAAAMGFALSVTRIDPAAAAAVDESGKEHP